MMNESNTKVIVTDFGIPVGIGNLVGFEKTVDKNKVFIFGRITDIDDDNKVTVATNGYKGNPDIDKKKFKKTYVVPERKVIAMETINKKEETCQ